MNLSFEELQIELQKETLLERFWVKVNLTNECWIWKGAKTRKGYGRFKVKGIGYSSHVISFILNKGIDTKGKDVCHKCDNPSCVNPSHLFLGTRSENMKDAFNKNRLLPISKIKENRSVLTIEKLNLIEKSLKCNMKVKDVISKFNISRTTYYRIKTKTYWLQENLS